MDGIGHQQQMLFKDIEGIGNYVEVFNTVCM
jgi:hypothetical protein